MNEAAGPGAKRGRSLSAASAVAILKRTKPVTRLIYFLYQLLQIALTPAIALYLLYRGIRDRRYFAHIGERLGLLPHSLQTTGSGAIWFHAVSVGGLYVGGGIASRIPTHLANGRFMRSFLEKDLVPTLMKQIPVKVILDDRTGLYGAAQHAATHHLSVAPLA